MMYAAAHRILLNKRIHHLGIFPKAYLMNHEKQHSQIPNNQVLHVLTFYHLSKIQVDELNVALYS
ncbi:hypothetical protein D3C84_1056610 [compost metagenome]